jgi:hypothetical protein
MFPQTEVQSNYRLALTTINITVTVFTHLMQSIYNCYIIFHTFTTSSQFLSVHLESFYLSVVAIYFFFPTTPLLLLPLKDIPVTGHGGL